MAPLPDPSESLTLRTRSLDGLVGGRYSTTKAPDAAAKGPPAAPGLVVGVRCASRGGEAA